MSWSHPAFAAIAGLLGAPAGLQFGDAGPPAAQAALPRAVAPAGAAGPGSLSPPGRRRPGAPGGPPRGGARRRDVLLPRAGAVPLPEGAGAAPGAAAVPRLERRLRDGRGGLLAGNAVRGRGAGR